ncbi:cytochrome P450 [Multifurca ochricompacta]|uniref:Cytochrome P450 n=1 Tax=Multifurca ochricompacta TaxID=376703 RepID=A0AAD4M0R8_9AGAM|nr:cytochrome P450 [Multifurca ochricompacta]
MIDLIRLDALLASTILLIGLSLFTTCSRRHHKKYPPGPRRLPVIGNLLDMPSKEGWITYKKWSEESGCDVVHADVMGSHIIILNSAKAANELLEKRSSIYSDRYDVLSLRSSIVMGLSFAHVFLPYGDRWRRLRRAFHVHFHSTASNAYRPLEIQAVQRLLRNLLSSPDNFSQHLRHMTGQVILSIAYGIDVRPEGDPYVAASEKVLKGISHVSSSPWALLLDMVPWLIHIPSWFPGASFKHEAQKWLPVIDDMIETPYAYVKEALAAGTATPSVTATMISQLGAGSTEEDIWVTKAVPGIIYSAGSDTTVSALSTFFLAMILYPEVQCKAQAEVDSITCGSRLPDFSDFNELPYVNAILKEVLRWHPVSPLSFAHRVIEDNIYEGHFIPAGSTLIPNVWAIMRDPITFPKPDRFDPERWLVKEQPPSSDAVFGYGRRICQGRFMARDSIWAAIVNVLATFDISPVKGDLPKERYSSGIVSYPEAFVADIRPRSVAAAALVRATGLN